MSQIPSREEQKDVTGPYIRQFLTKEEIVITETDAVGIANHISSGEWKAIEVTQAFCHRASLAHQLVGFVLPGPLDVRHADCDRRIACTKRSLTQLYQTPDTLMITWPELADPRDHFMAFRSA